MKKSVQIFLELISAIAIYLFISSIAYGDHLVTLPLYLTGVVIMSYLFVRERDPKNAYKVPYALFFRLRG